MIYKRTREDVTKAKEIYLNKVTKGKTLTEEDIQALERGMITFNTINRIENKQAELKAKLNDMGYFNTPIANRVWNNRGIFKFEDLKRLCDNNKVLHDAFFALKDSPLDAVPEYYYTEINALEKILLDISDNIDYTIDNYRYCGTFECGG